MYNCRTALSLAVRSLKEYDWGDTIKFIRNYTSTTGVITLEHIQKLLDLKSNYSSYIPSSDQYSCNSTLIFPKVEECNNEGINNAILINSAQFFFLSVDNFVKIIAKFCFKTATEFFSILAGGTSQFKCDTSMKDTLNCNNTLLISRDEWSNWQGVLKFIHRNITGTGEILVKDVQQAFSLHDHESFVDGYKNGVCNNVIKTSPGHCTFGVLNSAIKCAFDILWLKAEKFLDIIYKNCRLVKELDYQVKLSQEEYQEYKESSEPLFSLSSESLSQSSSVLPLQSSSEPFTETPSEALSNVWVNFGITIATVTIGVALTTVSLLTCKYFCNTWSNSKDSIEMREKVGEFIYIRQSVSTSGGTDDTNLLGEDMMC